MLDSKSYQKLKSDLLIQVTAYPHNESSCIKSLPKWYQNICIGFSRPAEKLGYIVVALNTRHLSWPRKKPPSLKNSSAILHHIVSHSYKKLNDINKTTVDCS